MPIVYDDFLTKIYWYRTRIVGVIWKCIRCPVLTIVEASICLSVSMFVCHTSRLYQNGATWSHQIFTVDCLRQNHSASTLVYVGVARVMSISSNFLFQNVDRYMCMYNIGAAIPGKEIPAIYATPDTPTPGKSNYNTQWLCADLVIIVCIFVKKIKFCQKGLGSRCAKDDVGK